LTGGTGFVGSSLLRRLLSNSYEVILLKHSFSDIFRIKDELERVKVYDLDRISLREIFEENEISTIIHCATKYDTNESTSDILEANLIFPVKLLEQAVKSGNSIVFINTDSFFNKEDMEGGYTYLPKYCLSKKQLVSWLKLFSAHVKSCKILNIVLEHVYGPYDNSNKFVEYMIRKIAIEKVNSLDLTLGKQRRDFVYIEDVCDAYIKLLEYSGKNNFKFCTFDIGYGESIPIREFITEIKRLSKSPTKLMLGSIPYRQNEIMFSKGSGKVSDIDFIPKYNYTQGIKKIINIYLRKG